MLAAYHFQFHEEKKFPYTRYTYIFVHGVSKYTRRGGRESLPTCVVFQNSTSYDRLFAAKRKFVLLEERRVCYILQARCRLIWCIYNLHQVAKGFLLLIDCMCEKNCMFVLVSIFLNNQRSNIHPVSPVLLVKANTTTR